MKLNKWICFIFAFAAMITFSSCDESSKSTSSNRGHAKTEKKKSKTKVQEYADESSYDLLVSTIDEINEETPMVVDDSTLLTEMTLEGKYVVYNYLVDEDMVDMSDIKANKSRLRNILQSNIDNRGDDENLELFLNVCKDAGYGIKYRYIGSDSGEECIIKVNI